MDRTIDFNRQIPLCEKTYDLVVAGGGPAGVAAALAAARQGLQVLLVEGQGQLGGTATSGLVSHWLGGRTDDCLHWVVGGIFRELSLEAHRRGIARLPRHLDNGNYSPHGWDGNKQLTAGIPFDPFAMMVLLDEVLAKAGVAVLSATSVVDTEVVGDRIERLVIYNKSGLQAVAAQLFVDATGDADLAFRSGCAVELGREEDRLMAPATLECQMDQVDLKEFQQYVQEHRAPRFLTEIANWQMAGDWPFDYNRLITVLLNNDDTFLINTSRLCGVDGTDGESVSDAFRNGRQESFKLFEILRRRVPGFEKARIRAVAGMVGIRETRRLIGGFRLTVEELQNGTMFPDTVGFSAYGWDLPDPMHPSFQPMDDKGCKIAGGLTPLPYRIMLPNPVRNLICPGRAVNVERDVLGPVRVMAPCMAMGEAAGVASRLALSERDFIGVDPALLRQELTAGGVLLSPEKLPPVVFDADHIMPHS